MALSNDGMPDDPFSMGAGQDLTQFAASCHAMYTSFVAAGFSETQALRITIDLMASMMASQLKAKLRGHVPQYKSSGGVCPYPA